MAEIFSWEQSEKDLSFALTNWELYTNHAEKVSDFFTSMLAISPIMVTAGIALQLVGGVLLFFSYRVRFASFLLIIYLLAATLLYQPFWLQEGPALNRSMVLFFNNIAIMGGLFVVLGLGGGITHLKPHKPPGMKKKESKNDNFDDNEE